MKKVETGNFNQLAYREGGGSRALFGVPFLAFGIAFMIAAFSGTLKTKTGAPAGFTGPFLFSSFFACVGALFIFGRSGLIFDKTAGTLVRWHGLLFPIWSKTLQIKSVETVAVSKEYRKHKNGTTTVYPLHLKGSALDAINITTCRSTEEARRYAEEIANFLTVAVVDSSGETEVRREAGTLDESLRERFQRTGEDVNIDAPPAGMRSAVSAQGNAVVFSVPPAGLSLAIALPIAGALIFACIVFGVFLYPMLNDPGFPPTMKWIFAGFIGLFFICLPIMGTMGLALSRLMQRSKIEANPDTLRVTTQGILVSSTDEIPCAELEELKLENASGSSHELRLAAVSDKKTIRFGQGLNKEELEWMRNVILKSVSA